MQLPAALSASSVGDGIRRDDDEAPIPEATWFEAERGGVHLAYEIERGDLADVAWLSLDVLANATKVGKHTFELHLGESRTGRTFRFSYGVLPQCQARVRIPATATNLDDLWLPREGAVCKPSVRGDRVTMAEVDRVELHVHRVGDPIAPLRWCQTPLQLTDTEPPLLDRPALPAGPLLDELGQSTINDWPGKSTSVEAVVDRLRAQRDVAGDEQWPATYSQWGGLADEQYEATGYFRTEHDGHRWWLVDPDGHPFWSSGVDCVRIYPESNYGLLEDALDWLPDRDGEFAPAFGRVDRFPHAPPTVNFLTINLIRAFGADWFEDWATAAFGTCREIGFNTVGNWSEWELAAERGYPYVRQLGVTVEETETIYRDFPDIYADTFPSDAERIAEGLEPTRDDAALVGYFLENEPEWGFADEPPAAGMLYTTDGCATRTAFADWLRDRHGGDDGLAAAWDLDVTLAEIETGRWERPLPDAATPDLKAFSTVMVDRLYGVISDACRSVDPEHLNLGNRYAGIPPDWVLDGLSHFDVFTFNSYTRQVPDRLAGVAERLEVPILVGEWHFGSIEAPLPGLANQNVRTEADRAAAFRIYQEDAAAKPWCVGSHWFTLYDKSALGRFDGENYNQAFLDVCHRPYDEMQAGARATHERLYDLARGDIDPFDDEPAYLDL